MQLDHCEMVYQQYVFGGFYAGSGMATFAVVYNALALRNQRRLDLALRAEENQRARMRESKRDFEMRRALGRLYWLFRLRFVVMMAVFFLALWLLQR